MNNKVDLEKLKIIELNLFREFIRICNKYQLKWFALGGTCLGAVRHQGFIPWDDDIDVGMPRDQYEKFLQVAPSEIPSSYFVQSYISDREFPANFAKLRDSNTTFIEASLSSFNINHGVYIDIFPLDGYRKSMLFNFLNALYSRRIRYAFNNDYHNEGITASIKRKIIMAILPSLQSTVRKREKILSQFDYYLSDRIANYCGAWGKKEIVSNKCFGNGVQGFFEGIKINLPADYDLYLTSLYGDYMKLPPVEYRVTHHYTKVVDLNHPYTNYIKEFE